MKEIVKNQFINHLLVEMDEFFVIYSFAFLYAMLHYVRELLFLRNVDIDVDEKIVRGIYNFSEMSMLMLLK